MTRKIKIIIISTFLFSNILQINSQRLFKKTNSGYLGKIFYITPHLGQSLPLLFTEIESPVQVFFPGAQAGIAISRSYELALNVNYQNFTIRDMKFEMLSLQTKVLKTNLLAPIGTKFGVGAAYTMYSIKPSGVSTSNDFKSFSGVICLEKSVPITNRILVSAGLDIYVRLLDSRPDEEFNSSEIKTITLANAYKSYIGIGILLF